MCRCLPSLSGIDVWCELSWPCGYHSAFNQGFCVFSRLWWSQFGQDPGGCIRLLVESLSDHSIRYHRAESLQASAIWKMIDAADDLRRASRSVQLLSQKRAWCLCPSRRVRVRAAAGVMACSAGRRLATKGFPGRAMSEEAAIKRSARAHVYVVLDVSECWCWCWVGTEAGASLPAPICGGVAARLPISTTTTFEPSWTDNAILCGPGPARLSGPDDSFDRRRQTRTNNCWRVASRQSLLPSTPHPDGARHHAAAHLGTLNVTCERLRRINHHWPAATRR
ncbi:hypothetical protein EJ04DRAFT_554228 [Polyplosphaeria fusca]|uniref:Uncharacterized protein n=1 Tax=Polyplosphaeria fusca TaxID=682080 RepID=A0A9P4QV86_9PLEO|nr:hypothetical protein EJ04DRAFT_554228 [Polyplosphaeria fusca]